MKDRMELVEFFRARMASVKRDGIEELMKFIEKSVMMIESYMRLKSAERYAIRWHMGPYSGQQDWNTFGAAMEKYPLVLALFEADMEASSVLEKK